jgi:hypothetical protein
MIECSCGSTRPRRPLSDARGIFVAYVCDRCEREVKRRYRPEIFTDANYDTGGEPIEGDFFR